ncbi:hypothetical protein LTR84_011242 [Exophiala bonariae]|uniref:Uncharacterized protein n=1 Tax=Exophiala bonariae TaxID=1690606 RepID=A0AAV9MSB5_9EURO|nr:hypothetical protein LTR84_011242 [Exophiala bonariae]
MTTLECDYQIKLLWEEDALQRNIAHGRGKAPARKREVAQLVEQPLAYRVSEYEFCNTTTSDFDAMYWNSPSSLGIDDEDDSDVEEVVRATGLKCIPVPPHSPYLGSDAFLLDYYISELSPKCSLSRINNPYLYTLLPVAFEFEPLRNALLAAAANELRLQQHGEFEKLALKLRDAAIRGLRAHLQTAEMDWRGLAVMLMFCFYDISDGCAPSWITHHKMALKMLDRLRANSKTDTSLKALCEIYFVAHEVMGQTAWENPSPVRDLLWIPHNPQEIDVLTGCSRQLLSIIHRISSLAQRIRQNTFRANDQLLSEKSALIQELLTLHQVPASGSNDLNVVQTVAEAKRLAALIYLEEKLPVVGFPEPRQIDPTAIVQDLLEVLSGLPLHNAATLWPLFVLGVSRFTTHDQLMIVLSRLLCLEQSRPLGSICHARRIVQGHAGDSPLSIDRYQTSKARISLA